MLSLQTSALSLTVSRWMVVSAVISFIHVSIIESALLTCFCLVDDELGSQRQRSSSVQYSPRLHHAETLDFHYNKDFRVSTNDQLADSRYTARAVTHGIYLYYLLPVFVRNCLK